MSASGGEVRCRIARPDARAWLVACSTSGCRLPHWLGLAARLSDGRRLMHHPFASSGDVIATSRALRRHRLASRASAESIGRQRRRQANLRITGRDLLGAPASTPVMRRVVNRAASLEVCSPSAHTGRVALSGAGMPTHRLSRPALGRSRFGVSRRPPAHVRTIGGASPWRFFAAAEVNAAMLAAWMSG